MLLSASNYQSLCFLSSLVSRAVAALLDLFSSENCRNIWYRFSHSASQYVVVSTTMRHRFFDCGADDVAEVLIGLIHVQ